MTHKKESSVYLKIFLVCFLSMLIILISDMARNNGVFLYAGDYTVQQIPFYHHSSEVIRNTGFGWDWYTDIGSDFITSYSFYLLGSLFFWSISWIKGMGIIYAMSFMIAVKIAFGSVGALMYIRRYVKNDQAAFIGAFLYAFSGFHMVTLIYNHFYDITALFPFLLVAFDLLVTENKKGLFTLTAGLTALTNYFFFVGTVFFVILYYIIKCIKKDFVFRPANFGLIVLESLMGVGIAAVILLPNFLIIRSADRVGDTLYGIDLLTYSDTSIIPKILQGLFMLPDPEPGSTLFHSADKTHNWASNSFFLPVFAITGVVTYIKNNSKSWLSLILKISLFVALIPCFNSVFSLFNGSYYARWFYMPVLLMCLATAKALEKGYDLKNGIKVQGIALAVLAFISVLPDKVDVSEDISNIEGMIDTNQEHIKEIKWFGMTDIPEIFWQYMAFAAVSLLLVFAYDREKSKDEKLLKKFSGLVVAFTIIMFVININNVVSQCGISQKYSYDTLIDYRPDIEEEGFFRTSHVSDNSYDNDSLMWGVMNAGCYNSTESNEGDDFYEEVKGFRRMMSSQYRQKDYPVYGLLSVKYLFNVSTNDDLNVEIDHIEVPGFSLYDKQGWFYIYKNDFYVPMGYMYDYCIDAETLEKYLNENIKENKYQYKQLAMMRALVMSDEDIEKYSDYIKKIPVELMDSLDEETYFSDCSDRSSESCSSFEYSSKGFSAEISADRSGLVYFSVPCSDGWTAKVNGKESEIIKVHYGLTAVAVEKGESLIEFNYETPGLKNGAIISMVSVGALILYLAAGCMLKKSRNKEGSKNAEK